MLKLNIAVSEEYFDEEKQEFVPETFFALELEHSLVSLSKWESKHEKRFLDETEKTDEETLDYIRSMIITPVFPSDIFKHFTQKNFETVQEYIGAKMTATTFGDADRPASPSREKISSELIYYWMVSYQIPWEAQYWHLNRLFTLIKVFSAKQEKPKPMNTQDAAARRRALNEQRRAQLGTSG